MSVGLFVCLFVISESAHLDAIELRLQFTAWIASRQKVNSGRFRC